MKCLNQCFSHIYREVFFPTKSRKLLPNKNSILYFHAQWLFSSDSIFRKLYFLFSYEQKFRTTALRLKCLTNSPAEYISYIMMTHLSVVQYITVKRQCHGNYHHVHDSCKTSIAKVCGSAIVGLISDFW